VQYACAPLAAHVRFRRAQKSTKKLVFSGPGHA
jgi:hypothetical protein